MRHCAVVVFCIYFGRLVVGEARSKVVVNEHSIEKDISISQLEEFLAYFINGIVTAYQHEDAWVIKMADLTNSSFFKENIEYFRGSLKSIDYMSLQSLESPRKTPLMMNIRNTMLLDAILSPKAPVEANIEWESYEEEIVYIFKNKFSISLRNITNQLITENDKKPLAVISSIFYPNSGMPRFRFFTGTDLHYEKYPKPLIEMCRKHIRFNKGKLYVGRFFDKLTNVLQLDRKDLYRWLGDCVETPNVKFALYFASIEKSYVPVEMGAYDNKIVGLDKSDARKRVDVDVYIEALCVDVQKFVLEQLVPVWDQISSLASVNFVTFGKATVKTLNDATAVDFECQHGKEECIKNKMLSCAMVILPPTSRLSFLVCVMNDFMSQNYTECSRKVSLPYFLLEDCYMSAKGTEILYSNGVETLALKPKLHFVPTITVDKFYDKNSLTLALEHFHDFICESYSKKFQDSIGIGTPPGCKATMRTFFNSFDQATVHFIRTQLMPTWRKVGHSMKVETFFHDNFKVASECSSFSVECHLNEVFVCLNEMVSDNQRMEVMFCVLDDGQKENHAEMCIEEQGVKWASLRFCVEKLHKHSNDSKILQSAHIESPLFIEFNGVRNETYSHWARSDLYLLVCDSYGMIANGNTEAPAGCPVRVDLYIQSMCSDTRNFFANQFMPAYEKINCLIDLHLIPYGKANVWLDDTGNSYNFECQHGKAECDGNKVMSCIVEYLATDVQVRMIACMLADVRPAYAGSKCAKSLSIDWEPLEKCSTSDEGSVLLYKNGLKTMKLKPTLFFIPTITVNNFYDKNQLETSLQNFHKQICTFYDSITVNRRELTPKGCKVDADIFFDLSSQSSRKFLSEKLAKLWTNLHHSLHLQLYLVPDQMQKRDFAPDGCDEERLLACSIEEADVEKAVKFMSCYLHELRGNTCSAGQQCAKKLFLNWKNIRFCATSDDSSRILSRNQDAMHKQSSIQKFPALVLNGRHIDTTQMGQEGDPQKIICSSFYHPEYPHYKQWKPAGCPVSVDIYAEALSPRAKRFFLRQLVPTWHDLKDVMHVRIFPIGTAKAKSLDSKMDIYEFECETKGKQCRANILMSCITENLTIDLQLPIISCLVKNGFASASVEQCIRKRGVAWNSIDSCVRYEGERILRRNELQTNDITPNIFHVPAVIINGHHNKERLRESLGDLRSVVCKTYLSADPENIAEIPEACKVKVRILLGDFDIQLKEFYTFTLEQFATDFKDIAQLQFVPLLGLKDRHENSMRNCSLPTGSCYQSKVLACFFASHDVHYQMDLLSCVMSKDHPKKAVTECGVELLVDMKQVHACANSPKADAIMKALLKDFPKKWILSRRLPIVVVGKRVLTNPKTLSKIVCENYGGVTSLCQDSVSP